MDYTLILTIIIIVFLIALITYLIIRFLKKRKKSNIPQEVIEQFNELEKALKDSNGKKTGQQVMWDYYNKDKVNPIIKEEYKPSIKAIPNNKLNNLFRRK